MQLASRFIKDFAERHRDPFQKREKALVFIRGQGIEKMVHRGGGELVISNICDAKAVTGISYSFKASLSLLISVRATRNIGGVFNVSRRRQSKWA